MSQKFKIRVKNSGIVKLKTIRDKDGDGDMFIAEVTKNIPFKIKRVFFINSPKRKKSIRGRHAHKKFNQAIFCVNGSFVLNLDDGYVKQRILMKDPSVGVLLGPELWHTMTNISKDCNILVLADDFYHEGDYIRNYGEFLKYIGKSRTKSRSRQGRESGRTLASPVRNRTRNTSAVSYGARLLRTG